MQSRLHIAAAALLAATSLGGAPTSRGAEPDARATIMARQEMRAELAKAVEGGSISPRDQYRLVLKAKDRLSSADFEGFQRTLDRLASNSGEPAVEKYPRLQAVRGSLREMLSPEDSSSDRQASYDSVDGTQPAEGSPFEEDPSSDAAQPSAEDFGEFQGRRRWLREEGGVVDRLNALSERGLVYTSVFSTVDAFRSPLDLLGNANFGVRAGVNGAIPLSERLGIGLQGGTSASISDFQGLPDTVVANLPGNRTQQFLTVGLFQRMHLRAGSLNWGFGYDWLFDNYLAVLTFGQWRVKLGYEFSPCNEVGVWAAIHDRLDTLVVHLQDGGVSDPFTFRPISQGSVYWRHTWRNDASVTGRMGIAEKPGELVFGADSSFPISRRLAIIGSFNYILPNAREVNGAPNIGHEEEMWNVSVGVEFVPGGFQRCVRHRFSPLLPLADNGSFGVRELR